MDTRTRTTRVASLQEASANRRRSDIFSALHQCVIDKGYAKTTLAEIARAAGMSPSHLLYYFSDKADILAQYFGHISRRIITRLEAIRGEDPDRQIDLLTKLFFAEKGVSKSEIGFMLECFGVAVHDDQLKQQKTDLDRFCKTYLRELFAKCPCGPERAADAAEIAYALLVGLRPAVYFDEQIGLRHAAELFRNEMLNMAKSDSGAQLGTPRVIADVPLSVNATDPA